MEKELFWDIWHHANDEMKCCHIRTYIVIQTYSRSILKCMFCWVTVIGLELHLLIVLFLWGILYDLEENVVLLQLKYENINIFSLIKTTIIMNVKAVGKIRAQPTNSILKIVIELPNWVFSLSFAGRLTKKFLKNFIHKLYFSSLLRLNEHWTILFRIWHWTGVSILHKNFIQT